MLFLSSESKISQARNQIKQVASRAACPPTLKMAAICSSETSLDFQRTIARVFSRDRLGKVAQWKGRSIRESWGVLWLVIRLLSVRADVSSSVRSIFPCTERLYYIPLHTCQHAGALPTTTNTSPTSRRRTVRSKYYYCTLWASWICDRGTAYVPKFFNLSIAMLPRNTATWELKWKHDVWTLYWISVWIFLL
jgi:hypothetical protein